MAAKSLLRETGCWDLGSRWEPQAILQILLVLINIHSQDLLHWSPVMFKARIPRLGDDSPTAP